LVIPAGSNSVSDAYINRRNAGAEDGGAGPSEDRWGHIKFNGNQASVTVIRDDSAAAFDEKIKAATKAGDANAVEILKKQKAFYVAQMASAPGSANWGSAFDQASPSPRPDYGFTKGNTMVSGLYYALLALRFAPASEVGKVVMFQLQKKDGLLDAKFSNKTTGLATMWTADISPPSSLLYNPVLKIFPTVTNATHTFEKLEIETSGGGYSVSGSLSAPGSCVKN
jgi:hypothetical protein